MERKLGTEVGVNSCLVALIATESVSIALSWLLLPPEVGVNRHGLLIIIYNSYVHVADNSKFLQPKDLSASHLQLVV